MWLNVSLQLRTGGDINDWLSFATFTAVPNDTWQDGDTDWVVVVNLNPDNYVYANHVPYWGLQEQLYQANSGNGGPVFPMSQWVRLDVYLNMNPTDGYMKVWQNKVLVSHAQVLGRSNKLSQAHFGLYCSPLAHPVTCYNDKLRIVEVVNEDMAMQLVNDNW